MKRYELGATDLAQYNGLTEAEREAWLHPDPTSYHSFHVERMGADVYRWRDSKTADFFVGTGVDLTSALLGLRCRKLDPHYKEHVTAVRLLSQSEIDDLLSDL